MGEADATPSYLQPSTCPWSNWGGRGNGLVMVASRASCAHCRSPGATIDSKTWGLSVTIKAACSPGRLMMHVSVVVLQVPCLWSLPQCLKKWPPRRLTSMVYLWDPFIRSRGSARRVPVIYLYT